ncbi:MAG: hypothetical protein ACWA5A_19390 [Marinibacterium sp.]
MSIGMADKVKPSKDAFTRFFIRPLEYYYGPVLVAIFFTLAVNLDQSLEVIFASSDNYDSVRIDYLGESWPRWPVIAEFMKSVLRVAVIATLPASVVSASRWVMRSGGYPDEGPHMHLARLFGAVAWGGYLIAIAQVYWDRNAEYANGQYSMTGEFLFAAFVFTFFMAVYLIIDARLNARESDQNKDTPGQRRWRAAIALIALAFLVANVVLPQVSTFWGPVATSAGMLSIIAYALAGLTVFSIRSNVIPVPAVYIVLWLIVVSSGPQMALFPVFAALMFGLGSAVGLAIPILRDFHFQPPQQKTGPVATCLAWLGQVWQTFTASLKAVGRGIAGFFRRLFDLSKRSSLDRWAAMIAVVSALIAATYYFVPACKTFSGCNPVTGTKVSSVRWVNPAGLFASDNFPNKTGQTIEGYAGDLILVGAQGGGLYAAYHAAYYLALLADKKPETTARILAVSSVSGGSVGAGIFWAVYNSGLCRIRNGEDPEKFNTCHRDAVKQILEIDYLSPMFATFYTRDLVDMVVPISTLATVARFGPIDRGSVFEAHLVSAYQSWFDERIASLERCHSRRECRGMAERDLLQLTVTDAGRRFPNGPLPVFNAVDVDGGDLIVMSPFVELDDMRPGFAPLDDDDQLGLDLTMVQAMVASARFPVITPPLRYPATNPRVQQIADGGYFDNSGIESIWDIINNLTAGGVNLPSINVVLLTSQPSEATSASPAIHGTLGAPISAFMSSWRSRQELLITRFEKFAASGKTNVIVCEAPIKPSTKIAENFTLSWFLSRKSLDFITRDLNDVVDQSRHCES